MWLALCLTFTFSPALGPHVDMQLGHGHYSKAANVHLTYQAQGLGLHSNNRPGEVYRPMAQFLRCR